ncbi:hypothetical protein GGR56DRAFT_630577 [Xylariaceae sp. FL0804]|nr:hypothetical protein GGR56DRAFT_630577 [Xylariaceae sp. FL0804]
MAPAPANGSARRKRTRPEDRDELASSPAPATDDTATPKRRRLNGHVKSSPAALKDLASLPPAVKGVRGRLGRRGTTAGQEPTSRESVYDFPESSSPDDERTKKPLRSAVKYKELGLKSPTPKKPHTVKTSPKKSVYEVSDSEDDGVPPKRSQEADGQSEDARGEDAKTPSRPGLRTRRRSPTRTKQKEKPTHEASEQVMSTLRRRGRPPKNQGNATGSTTKAQVSNGIAEALPRRDVPELKGILTPQKKRQGRSQKSVAFNGDIDGDLDATEEQSPSKSVRRLAKETQTKVETEADPAVDTQGGEEEEEGEEEAADSEDDEVCAICLNPDSEPPNEIIFCEICDMAVHQKCYDIPVIPEGDWICRKCSQEDILTSTSEDPKAKGPKVTRAEDPAEVPDFPNFEHHLGTMQRVLLDRCSGSSRIKLRGQDEAYEKAYQLVEQTVVAGEGNSMMVIGARGCGKTTLVEEIVTSLRAENFEEFHVVRLSGFIHTDDKLALKEIWRQLGKEMHLEDDLVNKTSNYADTMASLLALLSHPAEITGTEEGVTSKSVVFVIDEFDLFATHARQTLLYNLFDIAQARKAPIAVLGLTTRVDVVESLEKRVKSRFSHRYVYMSLPKTLQAYWDICRQGLTVDEDDLEAEGFDSNVPGLDLFREYWDKKIKVCYVPHSFSLVEPLTRIRRSAKHRLLRTTWNTTTPPPSPWPRSSRRVSCPCQHSPHRRRTWRYRLLASPSHPPLPPNTAATATAGKTTKKSSPCRSSRRGRTRSCGSWARCRSSSWRC